MSSNRLPSPAAVCQAPAMPLHPCTRFALERPSPQSKPAYQSAPGRFDAQQERAIGGADLVVLLLVFVFVLDPATPLCTSGSVGAPRTQRPGGTRPIGSYAISWASHNQVAASSPRAAKKRRMGDHAALRTFGARISGDGHRRSWRHTPTELPRA